MSPGDIKQGNIGNCWFLAGAAAIAEKPERLKRVFVNKNLNKEGIYALNMFALGVPISITVDDFVHMTDN